MNKLVVLLAVAACLALTLPAQTLAKPLTSACRVSQVIGQPMSQPVTLSSGKIGANYSIRLTPFMYCGVPDIQYAWTYAYKGITTNAWSFHLEPSIPLTSTHQRVSVTLTVSAPGQKSGVCNFEINAPRPRLLTWSRYLWTCK